MMPGRAKTIGKALRHQPAADQGIRAEHQHDAQARHHRRDGKRQVDQGDQEGLAAKVEFGDEPGRRDAEDGVQRHRDGGDGQRQPDCVARVRVGQAAQRGGHAVGQGFGEDGDQRRKDQDGKARDGQADQHLAGGGAFLGGGAKAGEGHVRHRQSSGG
jgi:hypothetical protein